MSVGIGMDIKPAVTFDEGQLQRFRRLPIVESVITSRRSSRPLYATKMKSARAWRRYRKRNETKILGM